ACCYQEPPSTFRKGIMIGPAAYAERNRFAGELLQHTKDSIPKRSQAGRGSAAFRSEGVRYAGLGDVGCFGQCLGRTPDGTITPTARDADGQVLLLTPNPMTGKYLYASQGYYKEHDVNSALDSYAASIRSVALE